MDNKSIYFAKYINSIKDNAAFLSRLRRPGGGGTPNYMGIVLL